MSFAPQKAITVFDLKVLFSICLQGGRVTLALTRSFFFFFFTRCVYKAARRTLAPGLP